MAQNTFTVTIHVDPKKLTDAVVKAALERGMDKAAYHMEGAIKDTITGFTKTGRLRAAVRITTRKPRTRVIIAGGANVNYARFVDEGTKPHKIYPKSKKVLAWPTAGMSAAGLGRGPQGTLKGKGEFAYAKYVNHPGFKGHKYMENTWNKEKNYVVKLVEAEIATAL